MQTNIIKSVAMTLETFKSYNPATLEVLGDIPKMMERQVQEAVLAARRIQPQWQKISFKARRDYLLKVRDVILNDIDAIAELISKENGKPILEAIGNDIMPVMDLITYFAKNAEKLLRREKLRLGKWTVMGRSSHLEFYPVGVVGVIAPWNFPFSIPMGGVAMALVVGNTVVLKPSEYTSLVGQKIKEIFQKAGLPQDVFQLVTGDGLTGSYLVNSGVDKIAFTGSVATGKKIMEACAKTLTPVTLELGGKDPMIVFDDADLDTASSAAVWGAFCNSGQVCASIERTYVHEKVYDEFTRQVVEKTKKLRQGVGQSYDVDVSAMTAEMQIKKVEAHVEDAKKRGAKILTGGARNPGFKGYFYEPTVITGVDHSFPVVTEETFGPVLPIMKFTSEEEALRLANDSEYALNAYVWGKNLDRTRRVATQIVAGTVNINESLFTHALPQTPWGGPKSSGIGRTHGSLGLLDLVHIRHVHENSRPSKRNFFWWYGYSEDKAVMMKTLCQALFGKGFARFTALVRFVMMSLKAKIL